MYSEILNKYREHLEVVGLNKNTINAYAGDMAAFFRWLEKQGIREISDITEMHTGAYNESIKLSGKKTATHARNVSSLKSFFAWASTGGLIYHNPADILNIPKVIKHGKERMSEKEESEIIGRASGSSPKLIRDKAILELVFHSELKLTEILDLSADDIDLDNKVITKAHKVKKETADNLGPGKILTDGKGAKEKSKHSVGKEAPGKKTHSKKLSNGTVKALKKYLDIRPQILKDKKDPGTLFLNLKGGKISRQGVWKIIKGYKKSTR